MTGIQWTEQTWNPIVGCTKISPGCKNCYAVTMANRLGAMDYANPSKGTEAYRGLTVKTPAGKTEWAGFTRYIPGKILEPTRRKKPTMWFTGSMSDMFHESVHDDWLDEVMATIAMTPRHTYQILTKRPERMVEYFANMDLQRIANILLKRSEDGLIKKDLHITLQLPLPNLWLGVSVENHAAISRIPHLLNVPAVVRFLSCEPLLEDVSLGLQPYYESLDWIIVGGESGSGARPFSISSLMNLYADCKSHKVPFFVKQLGSNPTTGLQNKPLGLKAKKGDDMTEWPTPYQNARQFPTPRV